MKTVTTLSSWMVMALLVSGMVSCKKDDVTGPPAEIAPENLVSKFSFDGSYADSKSGATGTNIQTSFVAGIKGQAYQGSPYGFISFSQTPAGLDALPSFTTSMWIKTAKHSGGTQALFTIPSTTSYFGNLMVMIDQNTSANDSMELKVYFEKNVTPALGWYGQYIDFYGDYRLPNMYNNWKQIAFTYDEVTSKFAAYLDGKALVLDEGTTDRYTDDPNSGGVPLGPLVFTNVKGFIIGGYQYHLGSPWGMPDLDMLTYTGAMDELRIYNKALTAAQIAAIYDADKAK